MPQFHTSKTQCILPIVSWTSACLRLVVAKVLEALLQLCLLLRRAERARVCRNIVPFEYTKGKETIRRSEVGGNSIQHLDVYEALMSFGSNCTLILAWLAAYGEEFR